MKVSHHTYFASINSLGLLKALSRYLLKLRYMTNSRRWLRAANEAKQRLKVPQFRLNQVAQVFSQCPALHYKIWLKHHTSS